MSEHFSLDNPKQRMREIMDRLSDQYGLAYIKCAVIKREDGEQCLYLADVKIQHRMTTQSRKKCKDTAT